MAKDDLWRRAKARIDKLSAESEERTYARLRAALEAIRDVPTVQAPKAEVVLTVIRKPGGGYLIRLP